MDRKRELAAAFEASLRAGVTAPWTNPGAEIAALFDAGQEAFPAIAVDPIAFASYLGARWSSASARLQPPVADLYLACACVVNAAGAHSEFERRFSVLIMGEARRIDSSTAFAEDVRQVVLERLFCARPPSQPKIAEYEARAPLKAFLRTVAVRAALNQRRRRRKEGPPPAALDEEREFPAPVDVETSALKRRYKPEFEAAARAAASRLSPRERALLRMNVIEGQGKDDLGAYYHVAAATAWRWLDRARAAWREGTREELGLSESQYTSLGILIQSRLDLRVTSLLRE